jgi:ABC-type microcin C transport system duplicated ATPase subunit YejF
VPPNNGASVSDVPPGGAPPAGASPLLSVTNLRVEFPTRHGTLVAVHDVSFDIAPGEVLGVVGESWRGQVADRCRDHRSHRSPGRIASGEIRLSGRRIDHLSSSAMRTIRGREIGAVFQDPLTSLNPLYTVGRQLVETIRAHLDLNEAEALRRAIGPARRSRHSGGGAPCRSVSSSFFRRHAAAGGDRACAGGQTQAHRRR